ncbi:hypothetical protein [Streptococcus equinus]|uniref:hypothetical protein n=1 Tax=Streptococcus equinus TaxID=1335 RepID=UPI0005F83A78|nr:hypothetical protein [Streptococcus equinus]
MSNAIASKGSISQTKSQLSSAKKKLKSAANSEALKGDVKDAIDNKITNYQVPLLTNYDELVTKIKYPKFTVENYTK